MNKIALLLVVTMTLAACGGGGDRTDRRASLSSVNFASGPIQSACLRSDRRAANRQLCGCIQAVANRDLSSSDQRLAVQFFRDPHQAQVIRQSDRASHEAFWQRYKAFAGRAERVCRGY
ncbi:hypothetical protein [Cognatishimia sp. F0-27]|uniref:hypothetical protein n=1 Tax=Cognatishimia sp. F0-27 TaxID=2816855 RepID=UPI001D0BFC45|nr:hypothetical protein [Cognatishimia sp. F0-27]MCC1492187.1 hypothetical protein [Cognatishimia sp. F0-27]